MDLRNVLEPDLMVMRGNHNILTARLTMLRVPKIANAGTSHPKKEGAACCTTA
jgi:hypothetical protein